MCKYEPTKCCIGVKILIASRDSKKKQYTQYIVYMSELKVRIWQKLSNEFPFHSTLINDFDHHLSTDRTLSSKDSELICMMGS